MIELFFFFVLAVIGIAACDSGVQDATREELREFLGFWRMFHRHVGR